MKGYCKYCCTKITKKDKLKTICNLCKKEFLNSCYGVYSKQKKEI